MQELPDELLRIIVGQVLEIRDGLRMWCRLSTTCKRLWSLQLPSKPLYVLNSSYTDHGVPWALRRLEEACKLILTVSDYIDDKQDVPLDAATAVMEAAQALMNLKILALRTSGDFQLDQLCQPGVEKLLSACPYLTALAAPARTLPRSGILQDFPLQHLELVLSGVTEHWPEDLFQDISCCHTLEVLRIIGDKQEVSCDSMRLPSMHLQSMPCLKHIRLEDCLPVMEFSLPAGCSLFLDLSCSEDLEWLEHVSKFEAHATVLRLSTSSYGELLPGILKLSKLQGLEISLKGNSGLDLADLRHIPHVKLVVHDSEELSLTAGSWETLEVMHLGELVLDISDINCFVRDTRSFTIMSESWYGEPSRLLRKEIRAACRRLGKAHYVCKHHGDNFGMKFTYITLSTSLEVARRCPMNLDKDDNEETPIYTSSSLQRMLGQTLFDSIDFWPRDPWSPV